eukprot:gnl/Spiro4/10841_TR5772_c0_g1_i1.p1 gnl/Spiro4/10841_TR5772_c0_g1~~gnl/Spiro4/10841_TR5772_c0_g1_i1.p1  ORF type:complete len:127 (+),score=23.79 gnl/Spiro4/10841_TR5772_c0_g1_i1:30-383(+)
MADDPDDVSQPIVAAQMRDTMSVLREVRYREHGKAIITELDRHHELLSAFAHSGKNESVLPKYLNTLMSILKSILSSRDEFDKSCCWVQSCRRGAFNTRQDSFARELAALSRSCPPP